MTVEKPHLFTHVINSLSLLPPLPLTDVFVCAQALTSTSGPGHEDASDSDTFRATRVWVPSPSWTPSCWGSDTLQLTLSRHNINVDLTLPHRIP